jgi:hypothetical protein
MVVTLQCNHCGKDYRQARHGQRFCTPKCRDAWWRHEYKLAAVKEVEAVPELRKKFDAMQIVEAIKYGRTVEVAPAVAENGMKRRAL